MPTAENKKIVHRLFDEGFNKGNFEAANEIIASDYVDYSPIPAPMPGAEGFVKAWQDSVRRLSKRQSLVFLSQKMIWSLSHGHSMAYTMVHLQGFLRREKRSHYRESMWKDSKTEKSLNIGVNLT